MKTKMIPYILLFIAMILAGCTNIESSSSNSQEQTLQNPSAEEENQIPPVKVALTYNKITPIEPKENESEIDQVLLEKELHPGRILIHTSKEEGMENDLFATYVNNAGNVYLLGLIGDPLYPFSVEETTLDNHNFVIIEVNTGKFATLSYYHILDGKPLIYLEAGGSVIHPIDMDADGKIEYISTYGAPIEALLYKWDGNQFRVANLNKLLGAGAVWLENDTLVAEFKKDPQTNETQTVQYEFHDQFLKMKHSSNQQ